jgi:hypothetical protein
MHKRFVVVAAVVGALFCGCCSQKNCVKDDSAQKSKIEAQKALDEMEKEKNKDAGQ